MLQNIPAELRQLKQWICWRYEDREGTKPTKVPYPPIAGDTSRPAAVDNPSDWGTFDEAVAAAQANWMNGIGLVFTANDPYAFIDLDDTNGDAALFERHKKIFDSFDSYAEFSPSGKGLHIIVRGDVPNGRKRHKVEVYSSLRYATFTGNVLKAAPIRDANEMLNVLWQELGSKAIVNSYVNEPQTEDDSAIINRALEAQNGEKFRALLTGNWQQYYTSQSEADFAFIDIIAFYSQNRDQIVRIFHASPLGQRKKATRTGYIEYMLNRAFDRQLPPVDIEGLKLHIEEAIALKHASTTKQTDVPPVIATIPEHARGHGDPATAATQQGAQTHSSMTPGADVYSIPPGFVGSLAQFIYDAAPRPVPEIALAGALSFMAGICGRAYNVSGTGLNQYFLLLADTGKGKEAIARGIDKLIEAVKPMVNVAGDFVGPSDIASGQGLLNYCAKSKFPCFVSVIGEFGLKAQQLSSDRANSSERQTLKVLLDLYNKSGAGQVVRPTAYSETVKNNAPIYAPAVTVIGESVPEQFFKAMDESAIRSGLLPRFLMFDYNGRRPPLNENHDSARPTVQLTEQLGVLMTYCLQLMNQNKFINVGYTDEAREFLRQFDKFCDDEINNASADTVRQLWNRAHIKTLKVAALVAIGENPYAPVISLSNAQWANGIVCRDVHSLLGRFKAGDLGGGESDDVRQVQDIIKAARAYLTSPYDDVRSYSSSRELHAEKILTMQYLQRRLLATAAFRTDRRGATNALKIAVQTLVDSGDIREIPKGELAKFHFTGKAFGIVNYAMFIC